MQEKINKEFDLSYNDVYVKEIRSKFKTNQKIIFTAGMGLGKSYVGKQVIRKSFENKPVLIVAPSIDIIDQWKENIGEDDNIDYVTYTGIKPMVNTKSYKQYAFIILDETHRVGAPVWNKHSFELAETLNAKVLGLSATPVRYSDGINVIDYFDVHVAGLTVAEGIERGLLAPFQYVACYYELGQYVDKMRDAFKKRGKLSKSISKRLDIAKNIPPIGKIIKDRMPGGQRKILVFYSNYTELQVVQRTMRSVYPEAAEWVISHQYTKEANKRYRDEFSESEEEICILYSINKLNEGVHIDSVNTVIMFRRTHSYRIFMQEIGRMLSLKSADAVDHILFDFAANTKNLKASNKMADSIKRVKGDIDTATSIVKSCAIIVDDYTKQCIEILQEVRNLLYADVEEDKIWCQEHGIDYDTFRKTAYDMDFDSEHTKLYYLGEIPNRNNHWYRGADSRKRRNAFCKKLGITDDYFRLAKNNNKFTESKTYEYFKGKIPNNKNKYYPYSDPDPSIVEVCNEYKLSYPNVIKMMESNGFTAEEAAIAVRKEGKYKHDNTKIEEKDLCKEYNISFEDYISIKQRFNLTKKTMIDYVKKYNGLPQAKILRKAHKDGYDILAAKYGVSYSTIYQTATRRGLTFSELKKYYAKLYKPSSDIHSQTNHSLANNKNINKIISAYIRNDDAELLSLCHKYKIYEGFKDRKAGKRGWFTYYFSNYKERKQLFRSSKEELEAELIRIYKLQISALLAEKNS
jgi:superfamily II DNA or RNA helicase